MYGYTGKQSTCSCSYLKSNFVEYIITTFLRTRDIIELYCSFTKITLINILFCKRHNVFPQKKHRNLINSIVSLKLSDKFQTRKQFDVLSSIFFYLIVSSKLGV